MATWPTGWREALLRASGVPVTQYALDVLNAWQASTPTEPWTNNPLGMPPGSTSGFTSIDGRFAAFATMGDFRAEFKRFTKTAKGRDVLNALLMGESYADAWREIHALRWPAISTESDWPDALMVMVTDAYTSKVKNSNKANPTTSGSTHAPPDVHDAMRRQAMLLTRAAATTQGASAGIASVMKGMNSNG